MARPLNTAKLNIAQLERLLTDRRSKLKVLYKERTKLERSLAKLNGEIASMGGEGGKRGGGGTRARNDKPLPDVMEEVMRSHGKPMGVQQIADAVLGTGFKTTSGNFKSLINQALIKDKKRFGAASRGIYQLKK